MNHSRISKRKTILRHVTVKLLKAKNKKNLKSSHSARTEHRAEWYCCAENNNKNESLLLNTGHEKKKKKTEDNKMALLQFPKIKC